MDWFDRIPKVELHVHLEGAIPIGTLFDLVRKYGGDPSAPDVAALQRRFQYRDFPHFIEAWNWKSQFLREYEDFRFIAEAVARDLLRQKIRYAEMFYSPSSFARHGLRTLELTQAIRSGFSKAPGTEILLVADLVRDFGPEKEAITLAEISEVKDLGVVGIGIGGSEHAYPPEPFQHLYETARVMGFRTNAHAGEAAGAASVWGALRALRAERIGHGTRAHEDPALLDYLAEHRIPLEMCPLSNVRTNVVPSLEQHPVRRYFEHGIAVSVNTDDPMMFGNSLADEFRQLVLTLGFSRQDVCALTLQALAASWLPEEKKASLTDSVRSDPLWHE